MNSEKNVENIPTTCNITSEQISAVAYSSTKVKAMRPLLQRLGIHGPCAPLVEATPDEDIDIDMIDQFGIENITRSAVRQYAGMILTCARMTAQARAQHDKFYKQLDIILSRPFSQDDYLAAFKFCPMSRDEYISAEREACERLYLEATYFDMLIVVRSKSGNRPIRVQEAYALRLLKEMERGLAASAAH